MAKIPAFVSNARLDTGNVVSYPSGSPVGSALQQAGQVGNQIVARFQQQQDELDNFKLRIAQQQLGLELDGDLEKATQDMPADASGLHDGFVGQIDPSTNEPVKPGLMDDKIKKYREGLPQSVQGKFDQIVPVIRQEYSNKAAKKEYDGRQAFYQVETSKLLGNLEKTIAQIDPSDTKSFETFRKQGETDIHSSGLSKIEKDKLQTKWRETSAEAVWKALVARDPKAARDALGLSEKASGDIVDRIIGVEKGATPDAKNPNSSATGDGQFTSSTWVRTVKAHEPELAAGKSRAQLLELRKDSAISRRMVGYLKDDNAGALQSAGLSVTDGNLYLAHFAGADGATKTLRAIQAGQGGANVSTVLSAEQIGANPFLKGMTVSDLAAWANKKMGTAQPQGDRAAPLFKDIPLDRRITLANFADATMNKAQTELQQAEVAARTERKEALDLGIETGSVVNASEVLNDETIDDGDKAILLRRLEEKNASGIAASQVIETLKSGGYLDSTDTNVKKGLNQVFKDSGGGEALVKGDQQALATTMFAWQKSNVIADDAKQTLQDMARSPDDHVMIRGLSYLDELQRRNPAAFDANFPESTAKAVQRYNDLNGFAAPNKIAEQLRERNTPEWQRTREPLQKIGQAEADKNYDTAKVVALFDDRFALNYFSSAPEAPKIAGDGAMMANDFRRLYADAYAETGDSDKAEANAFALLQKVWSPSELNGGAITRHAPEKYYPTKDMTHDWMKTQLETDLKALGYVQESTPPTIYGGAKTETLRPYSVRALPLTEAQIYAGQLPQYAVVVENPETGEPDMVTDKDGKLMLWPAKGDVPKMLKDTEADFQKKQAAKIIKEDAFDAMNQDQLQYMGQ